MKLTRLPHDPSMLADFFQEALEARGALCERPWHDRLRVVAEGAAARLWRDDDAMLEMEVVFPPAGAPGPRDAEREVYPGCPLTFRLAEALRPVPLPLQMVCLESPAGTRPPARELAEKLWQAQFPNTVRWRMEMPFQNDWHFSLLALARGEIQAIDQSWSLHRLAISLPDGMPDHELAANLDFAAVVSRPGREIVWPRIEAAAWHAMLRRALETELNRDLATIRQRQQNYLQRELERVDAYFQSYARELEERLQRAQRETAQAKTKERLAAAHVEHQRRRQDQVRRHEIRVIPHLDALLLLAEPAWKTLVNFKRGSDVMTAPALLIPRARRWIELPSPPSEAPA